MSAIHHRFIRIPGRTLTSPKVTNHKIRAEDHCRMCLRPSHVRELTRHHLVPVSWFMKQPYRLRTIRNAHANIIPLCRLCHDLVDNRLEEERMQARRHLRRCLGQAEISFAIQVRGKKWLDTQYPHI